MKTGNIGLRAGIEPTAYAFQASLLTVTPDRLLDFTTYIYIYDLSEGSVRIATLVTLEL